MRIQISDHPASAQALIQLGQGELIRADRRAVVSLDSHILPGAEQERPLRQVEVFCAKEAPGEITLAPALPGEILSLRLDGTPMLLQAACYLASTEKVSLRLLRLSALPFPLLEAWGEGEILCSGFGSLREERLTEALIVEPGHLVAFTNDITLRGCRLGGWRSFLFWGDEGACMLSGAGRVVLQSQSPSGLVRRLGGFLPPREE